MAVFGINYNGKWSQIPSCNKYNMRLDREYIVKYILPGQLGLEPKTENDISPFSWNKAYKTSVIKSHNIIFNENLKKWEDKDFVINFLSCASSIVYIDKGAYNYMTREESLSSFYMPDLCLYIPKMYEDRKQLFLNIYEFETDYVVKYYFDIMMSLIFEVLDREKEGGMKLIEDCFQSKVVEKWGMIIVPRFREEKHLIKTIQLKDKENYYKTLLKYKNKFLKKKVLDLKKKQFKSLLKSVLTRKGAFNG
jgi:hypothetical protein